MKKIAIILMICFCGTAWAGDDASNVSGSWPDAIEMGGNNSTADITDLIEVTVPATSSSFVVGVDEYGNWFYKNSIDDIKKALELAIKHIDRMRPHRTIISEEIINSMPLYLPQPMPPTPAQIKRQEAKDLMEEADQIEQCEKDLEFIKSVLDKL